MKILTGTQCLKSFTTMFALAIAQSAAATIIVDQDGPDDNFTITTQCLTSEVQLPAGTNSDACAGYYDLTPSNPTTEENRVNAVTDGDDWEFVYKVEEGDTDGSGTFMGLNIILTNVDVGDEFGTWTIEWSDPDPNSPLNLPTFVDIAAGFKAAAGPAGGGTAFFFFDDFELTNGPFSSSGTFDLIVNKDLSHESLFLRTGNGGGLEQIPEPGILGLLGIGLLGMGFARRRRHIS